MGAGEAPAATQTVHHFTAKSMTTKLPIVVFFALLCMRAGFGQFPSRPQATEADNAAVVPKSGGVAVVEGIDDLEAYGGTAQVLFCKDPVRGGTFVRTASTGTPNGGTSFRAGGKNNALWVRQGQQGQGLNVNWFGARGDSLTDNAAAIQTAIDYASASGGGIVIIPSGKYGLRSSLILKNNVILEGMNKYGSILYALADNFTLVIRHTTSGPQAAGYVGLRNLCLWGYGDRNTTQGSGDCRLARIGNSQKIFYENVYGKWARNMGLTATGDQVTVSGCELEYILRDGINVTECRRAIITNNRGTFIEDDFIAAHVARSTNPRLPLTQQTIVTGNEFFNAQGIVVLGARNATISNNTGRFVRGRGIAVGCDYASDEGFSDGLNILITNNTLADVFNMTLIGRGNAANAIQLTLPPATPGRGYTARVAPGAYDTKTRAFQKPDPYWNYAGTNRPLGSSMGIIISNNSVMQTLSGLTTVADARYGLLWTKQGFKNVKTPGTICYAGTETAPNSAGINVGGAVRGIIISQNFIHGFRRSVTFDSTSAKQNVKIQGNLFQRSINAVVLDPPAGSYSTEIEILGNTFDPDPYLEAADRAGGGWKNLDTHPYSAVVMPDARGVYLHDNTFKNCKKIAHLTTASAYSCLNNIYLCDPRKKSGIGQLLSPQTNVVVTTGSDPTSPDFNELRSISAPSALSVGEKPNH